HLEAFPMSRVIELSHHQRKPSPDVLLEICERNSTKPARTAYVGDSIARDMLMAKRAGVYAVWAQYGAAHSRDVYQQLVRVTHWTADGVTREAELKAEAAGLAPDYTLKERFDEILEVVCVDREETTRTNWDA